MKMHKKYEVLGVVGEGAYGIVYKCRNKETDKYVAIKKFKEVEDKLVQKTMKRELKMLQMLKHENVVDFQEAFIYKENLFLVFEYVEKNLLEVLEKYPEGLNPKLIRSFVFQMCKAVHYLHTKNIIHRDVKPENLLVDENMNLKLCDFGFARKISLNDENNNVDAMTDYVATRWYRSPELLLSNGIYGPEVDYWAIGCIMGELADGNPMFPGENEVDQIDCIIKVLGNLPEDLINMFYSNELYNGKELLKVSRPESLERRYFGKLGPTAIDFMKGLLQLDPNKRLNDDNVFKHKYFSCFLKEPENKYILDLIEKKNNTNNKNSEKTINNHKVEAKVINNMTNINIINYNNYNSEEKYKNNNEIENENSVKKNKKKKIENNESKKSIINNKNNTPSKQINDNNKIIEQNQNQNSNKENNINTNNTNKEKDNSISINSNPNTKKSLSVNKTNNNPKGNKFENVSITNNFHNVKLISLSQGKNNKQNNNLSNNFNGTTQNITQNNYNIQKINILGSNYNSNKKSKNNNNDFMAFTNTNLDGYKTFFNINKSKDKYNFKINTGYVKEEGKKYAHQNINNTNDYNGIIDENEEYNEYAPKKQSKSKEHKRNGQLLIKYSDNYKYNFNSIHNKNGGYGTFYKYNTKNSNFGFGKKKNALLPNLYKLNNNGMNYKNKLGKNKFKYY
jgi:cyclin-dependent kinase-like